VMARRGWTSCATSIAFRRTTRSATSTPRPTAVPDPPST
jgi:hypothetical protein